MGEESYEPMILNASYTPSPAVSGEPFLLQVAAVDLYGISTDETWAAGELVAGEV